MIRFVPLVLLIVVLAGCSKEEPKQVQSAKPNQEMRTTDPAAFVNAGFLGEQQAKREALRKQIDSLRAMAVIDRKALSNLINQRKGELMTLKKNLRNSTVLTPVQRDSLIAPLEAESIELVTDLIAVAN